MTAFIETQTGSFLNTATIEKITRGRDGRCTAHVADGDTHQVYITDAMRLTVAPVLPNCDPSLRAIVFYESGKTVWADTYPLAGWRITGTGVEPVPALARTAENCAGIGVLYADGRVLLDGSVYDNAEETLADLRDGL